MSLRHVASALYALSFLFADSVAPRAVPGTMEYSLSSTIDSRDISLRHRAHAVQSTYDTCLYANSSTLSGLRDSFSLGADLVIDTCLCISNLSSSLNTEPSTYALIEEFGDFPEYSQCC